MVFSKILDLLFPPVCLSCRTGVHYGISLCGDCTKSALLNQTLFCGRCGARRPRILGQQTPGAVPAKICHKNFPYILGAAAQYDIAAVKNLILGLKFRFVKGAAEPLAGFLADYAVGLGISFESYIVVPVPLSRARLRARGFNQSELIAKIFAARLGLDLETKTLLRIKHTKPQSETKRLLERKENIRGCFAVRGPETIHGKNIILIDDVTTSGATLLEAATALKSAGAKKILALTAARA